MERLYLIDYQRVFLLVGSILNALAQLVEFAEVFFPQLVDGDEEHCFVPLLDNRLAAGAIGLVDVDHEVEESFAVGHGHGDTALEATVFDAVGDYGHCNFDDAVALAVESLVGCGVDLLDGVLLAHVAELIFGEGSLDGEGAEEVHGEILVAGGVGVVDKVLDDVPHHVGDVDADALAEESMVAAVVDVGTLLVHHVVILEQAFTDAEVVFLDAFLGVADGVGDHAALDALALLKSESVEHLHDAVGGEEAHELVLEGYVEH